MNIFRIKIFLLSIVAFWLFMPVSAQDSLSIDTSSALSILTLDISSIEAYATDSDFKYEGIPENPDSFRDRFLGFLFRVLSFIFGNPIGNFVLRVFLYGVIGFLVVVLINQIVGGNLINIFNKKSAGSSFSLNINEKELESLDLQALLDDSLSKSDFPAATRYLYLLALRILNEQNLITWSIEKTNLDYEKELHGHPVSPIFSSLTSYYEFVEYGDFNIDKVGFEHVDSLYKDLRQQIRL